MTSSNTARDHNVINISNRGYINGIQALIRIILNQGQLDRLNGLKTGGFISGYRGSPLGGLDQQLTQMSDQLNSLDITFIPGINEELGATAVWGSQTVGLSGKTQFDGVYGLWYGKAPGVDRCGDVFKHANAAGTHRYGGVLAIAGDDPMAKSSSLPNQSEFAFIDAEMPVLNPSNLQDVIDYGYHGYQLSRFASLWVGFIAVTNIMDSSGIVDIAKRKFAFSTPSKDQDPRLHGNIHKLLTLANRAESEASIRHIRLPAAQAYVRANNLDHVAFGHPIPRYGIITTGKAYSDLMQVLQCLEISEKQAQDMKLGIYKVAMPWPLEPVSLRQFIRHAERLMIIEHKRSLMEFQIKDLLYHRAAENRPLIWGKTTPKGIPFLPRILELNITDIMRSLCTFLPQSSDLKAMRTIEKTMAEQIDWAKRNTPNAHRTPYFCSGCPHAISTKVSTNQRAAQGVGCHAMAQVNDWTSEGLSAMGGEGIQWIGKAPFDNDKHIFVNLGDGTYFHSGILAIRQAIAAKVNITYKILYNQVIAMTGGQPHDGSLTVPQLVRQIIAEGVTTIAIVSKQPSNHKHDKQLPSSVTIHHRDMLPQIQDKMAKMKGTTVILYDQVCATEKRRERKRTSHGKSTDWLFINDRICEACGDCTTQSSCLSIEPHITAFGEKRRINQSSCNKDYSCLKGFCPSFVWLKGAKKHFVDTKTFNIDALITSIPSPKPKSLDTTYNILIAGIGGGGVTTAANLLAKATHLKGLEASTLDVTGLAQKGGPVTSHIRLSPNGMPIITPYIPTANIDLLIAADSITAASRDVLSMVSAHRTVLIGDTEISPTSEFILHQHQSIKNSELQELLTKTTCLAYFAPVKNIAERFLGDTIYAPSILIGIACQQGHLPISHNIIEMTIQNNGIASDENIRAFRLGRLLVAKPEKIHALLDNEIPHMQMPLDERIAFLANDLRLYQNQTYANRFVSMINIVRKADQKYGNKTMQLTTITVESLYRLMAYKDEYEIARLYLEPAFYDKIARNFSGIKKQKIMLAPPLWPDRNNANGYPQKYAFGPWIFSVFKILARIKAIRGTFFDPFGWTKERRIERNLIKVFEQDLHIILQNIEQKNYQLLCNIAKLPNKVRGFGLIKQNNIKDMQQHRKILMQKLYQPISTSQQGGIKNNKQKTPSSPILNAAQ